MKTKNKSSIYFIISVKMLLLFFLINIPSNGFSEEISFPIIGTYIIPNENQANPELMQNNEITIHNTLKAILFRINEKLIPNKELIVGIPNNNSNNDYYINFELLDINGINVFKNNLITFLNSAKQKLIFENEKNSSYTFCLFMFNEKEIEKIPIGKYKLNIIFYKKNIDKYKKITSSSDFTLLNENNINLIDTTPWLYFRTGALLNRYNEYYNNTDLCEKLFLKAIDLKINSILAYKLLIDIYLAKNQNKSIVFILDNWMKIRNNIYHPTFKTSMKNSLPIKKDDLLKVLKNLYPKDYKELIKKYFPEN